MPDVKLLPKIRLSKSFPDFAQYPEIFAVLYTVESSHYRILVFQTNRPSVLSLGFQILRLFLQ